MTLCSVVSLGRYALVPAKVAAEIAAAEPPAQSGRNIKRKLPASDDDVTGTQCACGAASVARRQVHPAFHAFKTMPSAYVQTMIFQSILIRVPLSHAQ